MHLIYFVLINIFAAFFAAIVGFGHALIATPLALTFLKKNTVFTAVIVAGGVLNFYLSKKIDEPLEKDIFNPLFVSSVFGMPFGLIILKTLPINDLKIYVGFISIILAIAILFLKVKFKATKKLTLLTGFICGVMQTSTSMTGPPIALLLSGSHISKNGMRKILVTFFFWISVITLPLFLLTNVLNAQGVLYGVCAVPVILLVGHIGNKIGYLVPHRSHRVLALLTVCLTGISAIYSGLK